MNHRKIAPLATALTLATAGSAVAAEVAGQHTVATPGQPAPLTIPGTGVKEGKRLGAHRTIIARRITLTGTERPVVKLRCAQGDAVRGLATSDDALGFSIVEHHYSGKRSVTVTAFTRGDRTTPVTGTVDALCV